MYFKHRISLNKNHQFHLEAACIFSGLPDLIWSYSSPVVQLLNLPAEVPVPLSHLTLSILPPTSLPSSHLSTNWCPLPGSGVCTSPLGYHNCLLGVTLLLILSVSNSAATRPHVIFRTDICKAGIPGFCLLCSGDLEVNKMKFLP